MIKRTQLNKKVSEKKWNYQKKHGKIVLVEVPDRESIINNS